jgi:methylase of polypeptide subunit release factors
MGGKLWFAPLEDPKRILDLGTGTGIWCIEMGTLYALPWEPALT